MEAQKLAALSWTIQANDVLHDGEALSIVSVTDGGGYAITPDADGLYTVSGLQPDRQYTFRMTYSANGEERDTTFTFSTTRPVVNPNSFGSTAKTLSIRISASSDDSMTPSEVGIYYNGYKAANEDGEVVLTGLRRNTQYMLYAYAVYDGVRYLSETRIFLTRDVTMRLHASACFASVTTASVKGLFNPSDLTVKSYGFRIGATEWKHEGRLNSTDVTASVTGLRPNQSYTVYMWMDTEEEGMISRTEKSWGVTTQPLTFETQQASATSNTSSTISAKTNCDAETGTGFEWRRIDAPDLVPSTYVECPVVDGVMAGSLRGLSPDTYYQYRPYYQAADGTYFYGAWIGFGTMDTYVYFEPTVRTLDVETLSANSAVLTGYALAGSDDIEEQGFEYWPIGQAARATSGRQTVETSGQKMTVTLGDLTPNTTYAFRAYVRTARATTYGEEQTFTTPQVTGLDDVTAADDELRVEARGLTTRGDMQVRIEGGGSPQAVCRLVSLGGAVVASARALADGAWQPVSAGTLAPGVYLLHVRAGSQAKTLKLMVK